MKIGILFFFLPLTLLGQVKPAVYDEYMEAEANLYRFNGNVLVAKKGKVIYQRSFGWADYELKRPLNSGSIFDCGSIAKEFTAIGILMLVDKGKISLTDTLGRFFPGFPYKTITIRHLLTHTSGVPDGFALVSKWADPHKIVQNDELIRLLIEKKPPLMFSPGERLVYSGTGFNILASVIEKVSGQSYKSYMAERIFKPLGMSSTQVANAPRSTAQIPGLAYGYVYVDSLQKYIRADKTSESWPDQISGITGEGMIVTTNGNMLKWDRALKECRLLRPETQQQMLSVQEERKMVPIVKFGYGMRAEKNDYGSFIFHNGAFPGYKAMHIRYLADDVTVIVLSNNESNSEFIADGLAGLTLNKPVTTGVRHRETDAKQFTGIFEGKYMMQLLRPPYAGTFPVEFVVKDNILILHGPNGYDKALKQEAPDRFFFADGTDQQLEFQRNNQGELINVWHTAWGVKKVLQRVPN
jgi:CubicO group peptidase (beta-lactamase class C family)